MRRRRLLLPLALALVAAVVAACGDDGDETSTGGPAGSGPPGPGPGEHGTGTGGVVIEITEEGGLAGPAAPTAPPLVVVGDGRVVQPGPTTMQYPGPLLPNLQERSITPEGIQRLLDLAGEHGLLADVNYDRPGGIMDAPDTVVTISAGGRNYEHRAYALGIAGDDGRETDPDRARLQDFVEAVTAFGQSREDALGEEQPYRAEAYVVRALPGEPETSPDGIEPRVVDWPAAAPVRLADAGECAEVPAPAVADVLAGADELTRFVDAGVSYAVTAVPLLPGHGC
jgi:hypothetical protein